MKTIARALKPYTASRGLPVRMVRRSWFDKLTMTAHDDCSPWRTTIHPQPLNDTPALSLSKDAHCQNAPSVSAAPDVIQSILLRVNEYNDRSLDRK
jgi:hypothetical protein